MALTITLDARRPCPFFLTGQVDFDDSYPTGGEAMDLSNYFDEVYGVIFETYAGYVIRYDYTNSKAMVYYADYDAVADGALIQVPDTTDLDPAVQNVRFIAYGSPCS